MVKPTLFVTFGKKSASKYVLLSTKIIEDFVKVDVDMGDSVVYEDLDLISEPTLRFPRTTKVLTNAPAV